MRFSCGSSAVTETEESYAVEVMRETINGRRSSALSKSGVDALNMESHKGFFPQNLGCFPLASLH